MATSNDSAYDSSLMEFFTTMLQEMYWSEVHLVDVLFTMKSAANDPSLKESFDTHRDQTKKHVERLEHVFDLLKISALAEISMGMQGLFDEGWQVIDETAEESAQRDVALIIAAQKVEHYEIACYGSLVTLANTINRRDLAEILVKSLNEEKETDSLLTAIAEGGINQQATSESRPQMEQSIEEEAEAEQQRKEALTERD
jgi:ferritin-like metal-binding protein YciE